jgi:hypothetical protein
MTILIRCLLLFCLLCAPVSAQAAPAKNKRSSPPAESDPVAIVLPASALHRTLRGLFPLPLDLPEENRQFKGSITVDSISSLTVANGRIVVSGQISGRNLSMNAEVAGQSLHIRLGSLTLPVACEIFLRLDHEEQTLFLTPRFQSKAQPANPDDAVVPLLNSLSREYAVPLDDLRQTWKTDSGIIALRLEPVDIRTADDALILHLQPTAARKK